MVWMEGSQYSKCTFLWMTFLSNGQQLHNLAYNGLWMTTFYNIFLQHFSKEWDFYNIFLQHFSKEGDFYKVQEKFLFYYLNSESFLQLKTILRGVHKLLYDYVLFYVWMWAGRVRANFENFLAPHVDIKFWFIWFSYFMIL